LAETFDARAGLTMGPDLTLELPASDQRVFEMLRDGRVHGALLPRPYAFMAEENHFRRIPDWPDVVDDPLPISIETTFEIQERFAEEFVAFLAGHREGIRYLKAHPDETATLLRKQFGHSPAFAVKTTTEYLPFMDDELRVEFKQLERLVAQVAPQTAVDARGIAAEWIAPGALRD